MSDYGVWRVTHEKQVTLFVAAGLCDLAKQWDQFSGDDEHPDPDQIELIGHVNAIGDDPSCAALFEPRDHPFGGMGQ